MTKINCELFNFVVWGVLVGVICGLGLIGNVLSVITFHHDRRSSATTLLQCLAVSDFALLVSVLVVDSIPYGCSYTKHCPNVWHTWPYIRYVWVLTPTSHMCSIWFVVLIALNRFWAVCRPHEVSDVWSLKRTVIYVIIVLVVVVGFNIPRFFEYRVIREATDNGTNTTTTRLREVRTDFGKTYGYSFVYKVLLVNILLVVVPLVALVALTWRILKSLHTRRKHKERRGSTSNKRKNNPQDITFLLVMVVVVAIICQTPLCIFHFVRNFVAFKCGEPVFYLDSISKLLVNINSCLNFVIYCVFSAKFRRVLLQVVTCYSGIIGNQIEPSHKSNFSLVPSKY